MPKNTPLPMQWLTVDGQNIPIVLPDHWDDDKKEWKTTGTGNPLPIANYTQNASGVWLPTSESNPVPTQVTGSNVDYLIYSPSDNITISAGSQIVLNAIDFKGSEFGFNLRLATSRDITVTIQQIRPNASTMMSVWELLKLSGITFNAREKLRSRRTQLIIVNNSDTDAIIHTLAVTDFL